MPQCQFLFSAVFGSRKAVRAIFSEFDETKAKPPIFPRDTRSQKGKPGGGPRPPNHLLGRLGPQARREVRREPRTSADIASWPIYCLRRENPKTSLSPLCPLRPTSLSHYHTEIFIYMKKRFTYTTRIIPLT